MGTIISQLSTGLYGYKALNYQYQLTDTGTVDPALLVELWANGVKFDEFEVEHYISKVGDDYTFLFNPFSLLQQYFADVESKLFDLPNAINTNSDFQADVKVRIFEYLPNIENELELQTSYIESHTVYVIKSNTDDLNDFRHTGIGVIQFIENIVKPRLYYNQKNIVAFWGRLGITSLGNFKLKISKIGESHEVSLSGSDELVLVNIHRLILDAGFSLANRDTLLIGLYLVSDGAGEGSYTYNPVSELLTYTYTELGCDEKELMYVNSLGVPDKLLVERTLSRVKHDYETFENNNQTFRYRNERTHKENYSYKLYGNQDIESVLELLDSNYYEIESQAVVVTNDGDIPLDAQNDEIALEITHSKKLINV